MNREEALAVVKEFTQSDSLIKHMLAVEASMRAYALQYGEDVEEWGVVGLLHDFDWEIHPNMEEHPSAGAPLLRERGVPEVMVHAILSHADHTGVSRETLREKALYAVDELTGLITAVALVRPSKDIRDVTVRSIKKKWKDGAFAAGVSREDIERGCEDLGVDLWENHVPLVLSAMQSIAVELGLDGGLAKVSG